MNTDQALVLIGAIGIFILALILQYFRNGKKIDWLKDFWKRQNNNEKIRECIEYLNSVFHYPYREFRMSETIKLILLQEIAGNCDYHRKNVSLHLYEPAQDKPPGQITKVENGYAIEIYMDPYKNIDALVAVLIHEFCHFYLEQNRVRYDLTRDNEILTDVSAVYFGFGEYMCRGYRLTGHAVKGVNHWQSVGYIDVQEIKYAMQKCFEEVRCKDER